MKKTFINPEMEVLRFQKGVDVLTLSGHNEEGGSRQGVRGTNDVDDDF